MDIGSLLDDHRNIMHVTVDYLDIRIQEQKPFNTKWYSHKFRGPALRYEVAVSVVAGNIAWVHGSFPARIFSDQRIFNLKMSKCLMNNEKVLADAGYGDHT